MKRNLVSLLIIVIATPLTDFSSYGLCLAMLGGGF